MRFWVRLSDQLTLILKELKKEGSGVPLFLAPGFCPNHAEQF